jgi:hypothetical protein
MPTKHHISTTFFVCLMSIKGDIWLADMVTNVSIRCLKGRVTPDMIWKVIVVKACLYGARGRLVGSLAAANAPDLANL